MTNPYVTGTEFTSTEFTNTGVTSTEFTNTGVTSTEFTSRGETSTEFTGKGVTSTGETSTEPPLEVDLDSPRRLRRSRHDKVLAGVCGGLGRYLNIDPVILRIITIALIFAGVGIVAYIIAWIVIPQAEDDEPEGPAAPSTRTRTALVLGTALVAMGGLLLVRTVVPWFDATVFWPLVVVGGGVLLIVTARR